MKEKKTIFITGGTGTMGTQVIKELLKRTQRFQLRLLVMNTKKERKKVAIFRWNRHIEIIYGNLKDKDTIYAGVNGADFVLHLGAIVSPMADDQPKECMRINYGSTKHLIQAIQAQSNAEHIGFVFIGTVGEIGARPFPIHWGRVGDPLKPPIFDYYSLSKVAAEREVIESGINKWVVLRQSGMLPIHKNAQHDPIIFHQNLNNALEWTTAEETGRLLANICESWIPDSFWKKVYNVGGGEKWRFTHFEFLEKLFAPLNINPRHLFNPQDLALYNFHGHWFTDSDHLNDITHFRYLAPEDYFRKTSHLVKIIRRIPFLRRKLPTELSLKEEFSKLAHKERGPQWMLENKKIDWIKAFWGSMDKKNGIKSWESGYELIQLSKTPVLLSHGYDEFKPASELDLSEMQKAAHFRGGLCLSKSMVKGDLYTPLEWQCHNHHKFTATPYLILKAGHWCDECQKPAWDYATFAKQNPFFAQVWTPLHADQDSVYVKKLSF